MSDFRPLTLPVGHNWHLMYSVKFEKNADTADMAVLQADVLLSLTNAKFLPIMAFLSIVRWCTKIEKISGKLPFGRYFTCCLGANYEVWKNMRYSAIVHV